MQVFVEAGKSFGHGVHVQVPSYIANLAPQTCFAFQRDQTLIRVISKHDFGPRHVESVSVGTGITWGAGM